LVKKESCIFFNSTLFANKAGKRVKRFHGNTYRLNIEVCVTQNKLFRNFDWVLTRPKERLREFTRGTFVLLSQCFNKKHNYVREEEKGCNSRQIMQLI
jgi:hypothetical protein